MREKLLSALGPILGLTLLGAALWVLHREFEQYDLGDVVGHLREVSAAQFALAIALTAVSYLLLTGYDALALRYIGKRLAWARSGSRDSPRRSRCSDRRVDVSLPRLRRKWSAFGPSSSPRPAAPRISHSSATSHC